MPSIPIRMGKLPFLNTAVTFTRVRVYLRGGEFASRTPRPKYRVHRRQQALASNSDGAQEFFQQMLTLALKRLKVSKFLVFALCCNFLLILAIVVAPSSRAWLQSQSSDEGSVRVFSSTTKRRRPEIVPAQALARFKPNRAFEGTTVLAAQSE